MKKLTTTICLTVALLFGCAGVCKSGDFQKGTDAFDNKDYATALSEWKPLAERGNSDGQRSLGVLYALGLGVPRNPKAALKWWRLAAKQNDVNAQYLLGVFHDKNRRDEGSRGFPLDQKIAAQWYALAAKQGDKDALKDLQSLAEQKTFEAQINLVQIYFQGKGFPKSLQSALKWYLQAARHGKDRTNKRLQGIKDELVLLMVNKCLYDEIKKITGPETRRIVEIFCQNEMGKKSIGWLLRQAN